MYSVAEGVFYDVSQVQRLLASSIAYPVSVLSAHGGPCGFPDESLDEDNYFLMCAVHHGLQVCVLCASRVWFFFLGGGGGALASLLRAVLPVAPSAQLRPSLPCPMWGCAGANPLA
jgi:hypothetical protein